MTLPSPFLYCFIGDSNCVIRNCWCSRHYECGYAGVLGGVGLGALYMPVYSIIGALGGFFDVGQTGVNVTAGVQATTIAARLTHVLESDELLLFNGKTLFGKIRAKVHKKKEEKRKTKQNE